MRELTGIRRRLLGAQALKQRLSPRAQALGHLCEVICLCRRHLVGAPPPFQNDAQYEEGERPMSKTRMKFIAVPFSTVSSSRLVVMTSAVPVRRND
ncbi:MAG: hypothetical protein R2838_03645 [Caldilineaceae bacterium]